jgi:4,5-dihydroxyphthalate decarboxylase
MYRMISESRKLAPASATETLPPMGLEANRRGLEMAIEWAFEQKVIPRKITVDELFDETTASLG